MPRRRQSRSRSAHDSVDSRNPSASAISSSAPHGSLIATAVPSPCGHVNVACPLECGGSALGSVVAAHTQPGELHSGLRQDAHAEHLRPVPHTCRESGEGHQNRSVPGMVPHGGYAGKERRGRPAWPRGRAAAALRGLVGDREVVASCGQAAPLVEAVDAELDSVSLLVCLGVEAGWTAAAVAVAAGGGRSGRTAVG